jgi:hypothetical protein
MALTLFLTPSHLLAAVAVDLTLLLTAALAEAPAVAEVDISLVVLVVQHLQQGKVTLVAMVVVEVLGLLTAVVVEELAQQVAMLQAQTLEQEALA